jgi:hypothetical protein
MKLFHGQSMYQIRKITFEIGMLGRDGWVSTTPGVARPSLAVGKGLLGTAEGRA